MTTPTPKTPPVEAAPVADQTKNNVAPVGAAPDAKPEEKAPTAAEVRKLKLKVNGKEEEVAEDEVIARAQRATAADRAMKEAAQIKKQNQEIIRRLKTDPLGLLSDPAIGHDVKKLIHDHMKRELEEANLTPQQKEERELRQKLKAYEEKEANAKKAEQDRLIEEHTQRYQQELETQITEVLQTSRLPKTNYTVSRIAHWTQVAIKEGYADVQPKDVVKLVYEDYIRAQRDLYSAADDDTLAELMGDELLNKAVKVHLKKTQKKPANSLEKPVVTNEKHQKEEKPKISLEQWMRS